MFPFLLLAYNYSFFLLKKWKAKRLDSKRRWTYDPSIIQPIHSEVCNLALTLQLPSFYYHTLVFCYYLLLYFSNRTIPYFITLN